jgi:two-component system response regulator
MPDSSAWRRLDILIVEDNPADVRMVREALAAAGISHELHVATDGEQALLFLLREGPYAEAPRPDLVLLDLRLPLANGFGVLAAIRAHHLLKALTVVIMTGSSLKEDELRSYTESADLFLTKPEGLDAYIAAVKRLPALVPA